MITQFLLVKAHFKSCSHTHLDSNVDEGVIIVLYFKYLKCFINFSCWFSVKNFVSSFSMIIIFFPQLIFMFCSFAVKVFNVVSHLLSVLDHLKSSFCL